MKILFMTCFESAINNGVYESQVIKLLYKIKSLYNSSIHITNLSILPAAIISRKRIHMPFIHHRNKLISLKNDFKQNGIVFRTLFIPICLINRWSFYLNVPFLIVSLMICIPRITYHIIQHEYQIIHCRSYVSTICALIAKLFSPNLRIIFDVRGFYPEEGIVHKCWRKRSFAYKFWKKIEKWLFLHSDKVIALSETFMKHITEIEASAKCSVVFASVDINIFRYDLKVRETLRKEMKLQDNIVFVYNGGLGSWHDPAFLAKLYKAIKGYIPDSKLLIITNYDKRRLFDLFAEIGISKDDYVVVNSKARDVAKYLQVGDYGVVPLNDVNNNQEMKIIAETMIGLKVAEYLACGLPIIVNNNVGGIRSLMGQFKIGITFSKENLYVAYKQILKINRKNTMYRDNCLDIARNYFSLDEVAKKYYQIYRELELNQT